MTVTADMVRDAYEADRLARHTGTRRMSVPQFLKLTKSGAALIDALAQFERGRLVLRTYQLMRTSAEGVGAEANLRMKGVSGPIWSVNEYLTESPWTTTAVGLRPYDDADEPG